MESSMDGGFDAGSGNVPRVEASMQAAVEASIPLVAPLEGNRGPKTALFAHCAADGAVSAAGRVRESSA